MKGERIVEILRESAAAVLRTHGLDRTAEMLPLEEMARNAAAIIYAEMQAEEAERETVDMSLPE